MELKEVVVLYRRWIWLLVAGLILGLISGLVVSKIQTPIYEASTKVLITRSRQEGGADILAISDQQLVLTYQQLLKTRPVLDEAGSELGIEIDEDNIRVDILANTQIIQIKVQDGKADQAVAIANTLVQILIGQNEILQAGRYSAYEEGLNSQLTQVQKEIDALQSQITQINQTNIEEQLKLVDQRIKDLQDEILSLEKEISSFPSILSSINRANLAEKQSQLDQSRSLLYLYQQIQTNLTFIGKPTQGTGRDDPQIVSLQATLNLYQQLYLSLLNNLETVKLAHVQSTPTVTQIEQAVLPEKPIRPIPLLYIPLAGMVGLLVAAGVILLVDYFDDTLKSSKGIQEILGVPVIGQISEASHISKNNGGVHLEDPSILNAFDSLRINVSRLIAQKSLKTILITSPGLAEGKTTIAANLAGAFVRSGKKAVLLDADLYHPQLHSRLGLDNRMGLNNILTDGLAWQDVAHDVGGITVIPSGVSSPSSSLLFESDNMTRLLEKLQKDSDVVIIDGPPLFVVDSQILASKVGGALLVVRQSSTITAVARAMLKQLNLMDVNVLGVVLNRVPRTEAYYFDGYHFSAHGEGQEDGLKKIKASQN
jgi:tyrosine-protein kinase